MFNLKKEQLKMKAFMFFMIIFLILTFIGASYVLVNKGEVNAGYAVIPSLLSICFSALCRNSKKIIEENTK